MARLDRLAGAARRRLIEQEGRERKAAEAREVGAGIADTVALGEARGEAFTRPKVGRPGPVRRLTGIEVLARAGKLSGAGLDAANAYAAAWAGANTPPPLRSCLADGVPGGEGPTVSMIGAAGRKRIVAANRLASMHAALHDQPELVRACALVLGLGQTPREAGRNEAGASALRALVLVAVDLLAAWDHDFAHHRRAA